MSFPSKDVYVVALTGAAGQIGYAILPVIARGEMLGRNQKVELRLLDIEPAQKALEGVRMELTDCSFPLLTKVVCTADPKEAFTGCDIMIMCGAFPRKPGMERKDLLLTNAKIFTEQGRIAAEVAAPHCRVVVVGNPANTNALLFCEGAAGKIDPKNISALTRLDHNRAAAQCALRAKVPVETVKNCIIWGNHSGTQVPDVNNAVSNGKSIRSLAQDDAFFDGEFITTVQQRGAEVMKARGFSSAFSAATAIVNHVHDWVLGTPEGSYVSMAVYSNGNPYGVPEKLYYSFPVTCKQGQWTIVPDVTVSDKVKELMAATTKELLEEREQAGVQA